MWFVSGWWAYLWLAESSTRMTRGSCKEQLRPSDEQLTTPVHRPGGGGSLRYQMATHCQTDARNRSGERQNIRAVNSFEGKKGGGGQLQTKHLIRVVACEICLFSLYFVKYMMCITVHASWNDWMHLFIQFCIGKV